MSASLASQEQFKKFNVRRRFCAEENCVSVVLYKRRLAPQKYIPGTNFSESLNSVRLAPAVSYEIVFLYS